MGRVHLSAKHQRDRKKVKRISAEDPDSSKPAVVKAKRARPIKKRGRHAEREILAMCLSSLKQSHEKTDVQIRHLADFGFKNIQGGAGNNRPARNSLLDILADIDRNQIEIATWMDVMEKALNPEQ
ncbi:hypothetical protein CC1G_12526 [Coprinopsis cinerea okayama7|uniref:Uncharacterized protein n=1 Tax=Coprinopsis cinerea (strain Okayama-7 / 130 / ATCC MYA-4618 / FGSC 9003) TaxID=240176 RepID=A8NMW4_COPC7|nr:hypothetical protein CC1G_12526 [Coprinopsis cinerea okayama7\|eukprot:XP_001835001.2 hypothetical protein CC1G_12526 [Coprinopsis cinerea okayama7\